MLKRLSHRERFELLVAQFDPGLRKAFNDAIADLRDNVEVKLFIERLERQDIEGAIVALHLDPAVLRPVDRAVLAAFEGGGVAAIERMPNLRDPSGGRVIVRFDVRSPRAETYARAHALQSASNFIDDQVRSVRALITQGLIAGQGPRVTARQIIGVTSKATGQRVGGVVGLSGQQAQFLASARQELTAGDAASLRNYLTRNRRDRRFDRTVAKAIRGEGKLPSPTIESILSRYSDRLLQLRGETIARTETMTALHAGKEEAFRQAIDTGAVNESQVQKEWFAVRDKNSRDTHAAANGERVAFNQRFSNGLLYPHAPDAPASECINCRCDYEVVIDFLAGIGTEF